MSAKSPGAKAGQPPLERLLPEEVWAWVDEHAQVLAPETLALERASGRVLACAVSAEHDTPSKPYAALDGYAVVAEATAGAGPYNPLPLRLAGKEHAAALGRGEAASLVCGQPLTPGADAVLPLEDAERVADGIEVYAAVAPGEHVVQAGEESRAGEPLLETGRVLRPQDLAWLRLLQRERIEVVQRPRVGLVMTRPSTDDLDGEMVTALVLRDGAVVTSVAAPQVAGQGLPDLPNPDEVDVVLVVGGTGVGANDRAVEVLTGLGALDIRGVAIRPGDALSLGRIGTTPVCLMPGSPLACLGAYDLVVGRLIRSLAGRSQAWPYASIEVPLARKIASPVGTLELCRIRLRNGLAEPLDRSGDRLLRSAVSADGFVVVPLQSEGHPEGAPVTVYLY